jgi:hypothetical protein
VAAAELYAREGCFDGVERVDVRVESLLPAAMRAVSRWMGTWDHLGQRHRHSASFTKGRGGIDGVDVELGVAKLKS